MSAKRRFDAAFPYVLVTALVGACLYSWVSGRESFGHRWNDDLTPFAVAAAAWATLSALVWALSKRRAAAAAPAALRPSPSWQRRELAWPEVEIGADAITIRSYPFEHASFALGPVTVPAARITSLFDSFDAAFVLDGREVVFLRHAQKEELQRFADAHGIAKPRRREVWMVLAEPFLDNEYTPADAARDDAWFAKQGFAVEEVRSLREEIRGAMTAASWFTLEWAGYTTQDVLRAFWLLGREPPTAAFYWHVMEVALRPPGHGRI